MPTGRPTRGRTVPQSDPGDCTMPLELSAALQPFIDRIQTHLVGMARTDPAFRDLLAALGDQLKAVAEAAAPAPAPPVAGPTPAVAPAPPVAPAPAVVARAPDRAAGVAQADSL